MSPEINTTESREIVSAIMAAEGHSALEQQLFKAEIITRESPSSRI